MELGDPRRHEVGDVPVKQVMCSDRYGEESEALDELEAADDPERPCAAVMALVYQSRVSPGLGSQTVCGSILSRSTSAAIRCGGSS